MKCPFVNKMHVCEIHFFARKVDEICWDLNPQPSVQQSIALTTGLRALVRFARPGLVCDIKRSPNRSHVHNQCTRACECMIAKPMNMANIGYYVHFVLYFGVLIRSSFGGVCEHMYIH
jgi:hypothetical protein